MRIAVVSLSCLGLIFAGCSDHGTPAAAAPVPAPMFSVAPGTYTATQTVTISDAMAGAIIYYTTDGTAPTVTSTTYTTPVIVSSTETLMATASAPGDALSPVASASYTIVPPPPPLSGTVRHGGAPIAGAHIYLLAANTTGFGKPSVSLLNQTSGGTSDAIGAYVMSQADGSFAIADYACVANTQVYVYALGGDSGAGNNSASGLLAILGNCPSSGNFSTLSGQITVNEVSTIAAGYAMAGFAVDATHVSSSGTLLAQTGIANAFANAASLADPSTGLALTVTPAGGGVVPQSEINTLADILAACISSSNAGSCSTLFANATGDGTATGAQPTDTATATLNIAHHPGVNVAALYALAGASTVFTPVLAAQPNDFTVALSFTIPNVNIAPIGTNGGHTIAIDGMGSVWIINGSPDQVGLFKLSNSGAMLSPAAGFTEGGVQNPTSVAIDDTGNAWIVDALSGQMPTGAVSELSSNGAALRPSSVSVPGTSALGYTIAIDASGNAWLPYGQGVAELSSGSFVTAVSNPPGASAISGIAIDTTGNLWGAVPFGASLFEEFSVSGSLLNPSTAGQFSCGALFEAEQQPNGVAIDATGNIWITSGQGVTKESKSPIPDCSGTGGGILTAPEGVGGDIAVDGDGNIWVVSGDEGAGSLSELSNAGAPISPPTGYKAPGGFVVAIAPDSSGNLWATGTNFTQLGYYYTFNVFEFIGASAPVVTPIATGVKNNTLGSRP